MQKKQTILIIGAGIGGLTTAVALQKAGYEVQIFEAATSFLPLGAGLTLASNALKAYHQIGLDKEVIATGQVLKRAQVKAAKGAVLTESKLVDATQKYGHPFIGIHRAKLHELLVAQLATHVIQLGKRCVAIKQDTETVEAHFEDGTKAAGSLLIAADGIHSIVRRQLFPQSKRRYAGYTCWRGLCHFEDTAFNNQLMTESWGWGERFGIVPIDNAGLVYWFMVKNAPFQDPLMSAFDREKMLDLFGDWHYPIRQLLENTKETDILWNDIIDIRPLKKWNIGRVTLLGDAAHAMTPNLGQGACQAIEDAIYIWKCLDKYGISPTALKKYEQLRLKRTNTFLNRSWQVGKMGQWENPLLTPIRNFMVRWTPQQMQRKMMDFLNAVDFEMN